MKRTLLALCAIVFTLSCQAQQVAIAPTVPQAGSISVNINPNVITVNSTAVLTAQWLDVNNNLNNVITSQCVWTTGNTGIAVITGDVYFPTVKAIGAGSTTVQCAFNGFTGSATVTVPSSPLFTNPFCGTPPCPLSATNGQAYSNTFTASGGVLPYTWSCPATCAMPGWASLNSSSGLFSGTAATGVTTFTVKVCDSLSSCATESITLTVTAGSGITYSSTTSTANPGQISAIFNAASAINSTAYDTSLNASPHDCYTRVTNGTSFGGQSVGTNSASGGSNDIMWSIDSKYAMVSSSGGASYVLQFDTTGSCGVLINTGNHTTDGTIWVAGAVAFSTQTGGVFYNYANHTTPPYAEIAKYALSDYKTSVRTSLVDLGNGTTCPGLPIGKPTWSSLLGKSNDDDKFGEALSYTGGQDTGVWLVEWSQTLGCRVANVGTFDAVNNPLGGSYWNWCTSNCTPSTAPTGTLASANACTGGSDCSCWGVLIHGMQMSGDGNSIIASLATGTHKPTNGACSGLTNNTQFTIWTTGTATTQYCSNDLSGGPGGQYCGGHDSVGFNHMLTETNNTPSSSPFSIRALSNVLVRTDFFNPAQFDSHSFWPAGTADTNPWVGAVDILFPTEGSGCPAGVSAVKCPINPKAQIIASFPNATNQPLVHFGHTFGCNPTSTTYANCQGPDWSSSTSYCINCIITPTVGNVGLFTFQNKGTAACTSGGSEPGTWNQTIGGTVSDGGCTWTNVNVGMGNFYFGCNNSIITVSQDGHWALIASDMFLGLGMDSSNRFRCDDFLVHLY